MSRSGVPDTLGSNNGTCFTANEFQEFCGWDSMSLVKLPVYYRVSNGEAQACGKIGKRGVIIALMKF